jgi:WD40 repeat protein
MKYLHSLSVFVLVFVNITPLTASSITAYNNQSAYVTTNHVFYNNEEAQGFVRLNNGFTVMPPHACANLDLLFSVSGGIDLRETSTIRLLKDLEFDAGVTLTTGGNIDGRGHTLILDGDFRIPASKVLHFNGDTILDAQNHEIVIGENAEIFVDTNVTLTIANATIKSTRNAPTFPALRCGALTSKLAFDNVIFAPSDDFLFQNGQLFIHDDVIITGTSAFVYHSPVPSFITQNSCLHVDNNVTLSIAPATFTDAPYALKNTYTDNNFIKMADETSVIYFNGSTLQTTNTGLRLTTGTIDLDNRMVIKTDHTLTMTALSRCISQAIRDDFAESLCWSSDGHYLAIQDSERLTIYSFNGTSLAFITDDTYSLQSWSIAWSPDGRYIASVSLYGDLVVYSFDGSSLTIIAHILYDPNTNSLAWSPDGQYLATGNFVGPFEVLKFDGTSLAVMPNTQLTIADVMDVNWNPDGQFLAVAGNVGGNGAVRVYRFDNSALTLLPGTVISYGIEIKSINWSPDGRYLAVGANVNKNVNLYSVMVYRFDGTNLILIPGTQIECENNVGHSLVSTVRWSPDGSYLAIRINNPLAGHADLECYSFDGSSLTLIPGTQNNWGGGGASDYTQIICWHPDGRYLARGGSNPDIGHEALEIYKSDFVQTTTPQSLTNSFVLGNKAQGSTYDTHLHLQPGASLNLIGKMLYDNVN